MIEYALPNPPQLALWQRTTLGLAALAGWTVDISVDVPPRCVIIGAHHTSVTDVLAAVVLMGAGVDLQVVVKGEAFRWPTRRLFTALHALPVQRHSRSGFVDQMVRAFAERDVLRLAICPEGTRKAESHWKTGFYHIAVGARVPIVFGYADYPRKEAGIGGYLMPSGDIAADFEVIRRFYAGIQGRFPDRQSDICVPPDRNPVSQPLD